MKRAFMKDISKEIRKTFNRYVSIIAIVALGVSLYVGINASSPDMKKTINKYFLDQNLFDLELISTVGFNNEDIQGIKGINGVLDVEKVKSADTIIEANDKEYVIKVMSMQKENNNINKVEIESGNYPENSNEILLDSKIAKSLNYKIGDMIKFLGDNKNDIKDTFNVNEYKIVGFVNSPLYISQTRGITSIGNGNVIGFAYILEETFSIKEYTNIYLTLNTTSKEKTSDEYLNEIKEIQDQIENIMNVKAEEKYETIYNEASDKIEEAKIKVQDAEKELNDAEKKIAEGKSKIKDAEEKLKSEKENYYTQINTYNLQIENGEKSLEGNKELLDAKEKELAAGRQKLQEEKINLANNEDAILSGTGMSDLTTYLNYLKTVTPVTESITNLIENIQKLQAGKEQLEKEEETLKNYEIELQNGKDQYNSGLANLSMQESNLQEKQNEALLQFEKADKEISKSKEELYKNEEEFDSKKQEALNKIEEAKQEIEKSEQDLSDLKVKIYILNVETNEGYMSYKSDLDRISAIGTIFPIIFFLVAALVSLTAMTRMVEENRASIGTYKSLGYARPIISLKYIIYSASATIIGILIGIFVGSYTFPKIVAGAYGMLYQSVPSVILDINIKYSLIAGSGSFAATTLATILACYKELRTTPAMLMRPKSPKQGKKILLEKTPIIWNRLTFIQKVTARNIFRYKKRLFMTIIGIAGCTALIFTGFGIRDSIANVVKIQYGKINKSSFELTLKKELNEDKQIEMNNYLKEEKTINDYIYLRQQSNDVIANNNIENSYIVITQNGNDISNFVKLKNRATKQTLKINSDGVIITEKLSKLLGVKEGDKIGIKTEDDEEVFVKVNGISENYIWHYIYMDEEMYTNLFKEKPIINQIYLKTEKLTKDEEKNIAKYLLQNKNISQVLTVSSITETFNNMINGLSYVVIVLIFCAALLAFIVLYNLNSINIEERKRELATIKLLGFYNKEVASYVFRENFLLTIIGALVGLLLGVYLHMFIIQTAEINNLMFYRQANLLSYIYAFSMTIVFAIIINLLMNKSTNKIDMIESLKMVE